MHPGRTNPSGSRILLKFFLWSFSVLSSMYTCRYTEVGKYVYTFKTNVSEKEAFSPHPFSPPTAAGSPGAARCPRSPMNHCDVLTWHPVCVFFVWLGTSSMCCSYWLSPRRRAVPTLSTLRGFTLLSHFLLLPPLPLSALKFFNVCS